MNDETILDQSQVNEDPKKVEQLNDESLTENHDRIEHGNNMSPSSAENKKSRWGVAAAAGAAGVGVGMAVPLIPKLVFPNVSEDGSLSDESGELEEVASPGISHHLTGHDMEVATSVDDSMSFNQAFAAARHEVGPGGLFVWHGHTYGTYYANEWNAMTPEDKDQYWADVFHTTSHIDYTPTAESELDPDQDQALDNQESNDDHEGESEGEESITEPQLPTPPDEGENIAEDEEGEIPLEDPEPPVEPEEVSADGGEEQVVEPAMDNEPIVNPEPLVLEEEDILAGYDQDGDGTIETVIVDANGNELPDVIMDTTGDGKFNILVVDPVVDENGDLSVADVQEIDDAYVRVEEAGDNVDGAEELLDQSVDNVEDEIVAENPDVDDFASLTPDPDVPIDNDMDMSDFS